MTSLDAVAAKLDDLKEFTRIEFDEVKSRQDKTNGRVGKLERWRAYLAGGMAVIIAIVIPVALLIVGAWLDFHFR